MTTPRLWVIEYEDKNGKWWPLDDVAHREAHEGKALLNRRREYLTDVPLRLRAYVRAKEK